MREMVSTKAETAIERIKTFEPEIGYYLAFSGGKDSIVLYDLTVKAGVKFDAHYCVSPIDPPELYQFIREHYPNIVWDYNARGFWKTVVRKGLPTRRSRWCCEIIKESGGTGRTVLLGLRWVESPKRKVRKLVEACYEKRRWSVNPILDWEDEDVWEYIGENSLPYCSLYDRGFKRIGCIMCPMATIKNRKREMEQYPKIAYLWRKACDRIIERRQGKGILKTGQELWDWWWQY